MDTALIIAAAEDLFEDYLCRRRLKPEIRLTRVPDFDGTNAIFTGIFSTPVRNVIPVAKTSAVPAGVMFGPIPNSAPSLVRTPTSQLRLGSATL